MITPSPFESNEFNSKFEFCVGVVTVTLNLKTILVDKVN